MSTVSLTVRRADDEPWVITHTDAEGITKTMEVRARYDAEEVLEHAERMASGEVLWRLVEDGFDAVVRSDVTGWPL